jgi:hypothetical protein
MSRATGVAERRGSGRGGRRAQGERPGEAEIVVPATPEGSAGPDLPYIAPDLRRLAVPLAELVPSATNARSHGDRDIPVLMESLRRFGQRKPIVARQGSGEVIAGNGTLEAARRLGWTHVAVAAFEGTDEEAQAYALVDNRSAELSEWNLPVLAEQLRAIHARDGEMPGTLGWDAATLGPLLAAQWAPPERGELPGAEHEQGAPLALTRGQRDVVDRAVAAVREREGDDTIPDGRAVELICADYLSGR